MAKAKQKKRMAKTKKKIVRPARKAVIAINPHALNSARILIISAGIITLIAGFIYTIFGYTANGIVLETWFALANFIFGIAMLSMLGVLKRKPRIAASWLVLFALLSLLLPPYGFIVGPVLALIAGILVLVSFKEY